MGRAYEPAEVNPGADQQAVSQELSDRVRPRRRRATKLQPVLPRREIGTVLALRQAGLVLRLGWRTGHNFPAGGDLDPEKPGTALRIPSVWLRSGTPGRGRACVMREGSLHPATARLSSGTWDTGPSSDRSRPGVSPGGRTRGRRRNRTWWPRGRHPVVGYGDCNSYPGQMLSPRKSAVAGPDRCELAVRNLARCSILVGYMTE